MKNKLKLISLLLVVILVVFSFTACGDRPENTSSVDTSSEISSTPPPEPDPITVTVGAVGDLLIHTPLITAAKTGDTYDFNSIFKYVGDYYKSFDYLVGNLEVTLGGTATAYIGSGAKFNCPDELVDAIMSNGMDMVLTANNHSYDTGSAGFYRTGEVLSDKGIDYIGTHFGNAKNYKVVDIEGVKIGMINYTYQTGDLNNYSLNGITLKKGDEKFINTFSYGHLDTFYSQIEEDINNMYRDGAEAIITYLHWGNEYHLEPNNLQKTIAQKLCDFGVDVIVGGHPHVVEPVDLISSAVSGKQTICIYSTGNAVSNQFRQNMPNTSKKFPHVGQGASEDGVIFSVSFTKKGNGEVVLSGVNAMPTWMHYYWANGKNNYEIIPLDKEIDYVTKFNLKSVESKLDVSYNRTMGLVEAGIEKFNNQYIQKDLRKTAN